MDFSLFARDNKENEDEYELAPPMSEARDLALVPTHLYSFFF